MAIEPNFYKRYHLSDVSQAPISSNGDVDFKGFGSDGSDRTDNIIYIGSGPLQRGVALKAFLESYKMSLTKETDTKKENDKSNHVYDEYTSELKFELSLNMPAESTNESRNNTAKIEELQRLISPNGGRGSVHASYSGKSTSNYFFVWFKNLIHSGTKYSSYPTPETLTMNSLMKHGFICYIDNVIFEPDMEAGFFEFDDILDGHRDAFLYPRNIKLKLTLNFGVDLPGNVIKKLRAKHIHVSNPLYAFDINGQYSNLDSMRFPFGIAVGTGDGYLENGTQNKIDYTTETVNELDYRLEGGGASGQNSFLFMSTMVNKNKRRNSTRGASTRKRWIKFKGFIDSNVRDFKVNIPKSAENQNRVLGTPIDISSPTTFDQLVYTMKVTVPSASLEEARKNCGKLQYLLRMFFKKFTPTDDSGNLGTSERLAIKVYSPSFIESPSTTRHFANDFNTMYKNALTLFITDLDIDIDISAGFFEEKGYLWPKVFSLSMTLQDNSGDLIKNYKYRRAKYSILSSDGIYKGKEHLFPFPRKTSKIKIGGS